MSAVAVGIELAERGNDPCPEGIQVDVADEVKQVGLLLAEYRLVAVLEKMTVAIVPSVKGACVTGQNATHHRSERHIAGLEEEVKMVREERPRIAWRTCFSEDAAEAIKKALPVGIIPKNRSALYPPAYQVVKGSRSINACATRHTTVIAECGKW